MSIKTKMHSSWRAVSERKDVSLLMIFVERLRGYMMDTMRRTSIIVVLFSFLMSQ
jgi:hypothetical protein